MDLRVFADLETGGPAVTKLKNTKNEMKKNAFVVDAIFVLGGIVPLQFLNGALSKKWLKTHLDRTFSDGWCVMVFSVLYQSAK